MTSTPPPDGPRQFVDADLRGARFVRTDLSGAVMRAVDVDGADIDAPWLADGSLLVNGELNPEAAWYYPEPSEAAAQIKDRIAFWKGVKVTE